MVSHNPVNDNTKIIITLHETQHMDRAIAKDNLRVQNGFRHAIRRRDNTTLYNAKSHCSDFDVKAR